MTTALDRPRIGAAALLAAAALAACLPAEAQQRRGRGPAAPPRLSEETLVPTELFEEKDSRRFGYPNGFELLYTRKEDGHRFKLTERSFSELPSAPAATPVLAPGAAPAAASEATPAPRPTPAPLGPTAEEAEFIDEVGYVRPTFVTLAFTDSPQAAADLVAAWLDEKNNEEANKAINLAVLKNDKDPRLGPNAVVSHREFNLGAKTGGVRRAASVVLSKGNVFLKVDARWGLKDGAYEAELDTLEQRARAVATYLARKL